MAQRLISSVVCMRMRRYLVVTMMKQLLEEGKSGGGQRFSILKNLVVMTNNEIDFIIDLYSKARSGELGGDIATRTSSGFGRAGFLEVSKFHSTADAPETERPLPSQGVPCARHPAVYR